MLCVECQPRTTKQSNTLQTMKIAPKNRSKFDQFRKFGGHVFKALLLLFLVYSSYRLTVFVVEKKERR